MLFRWHMTHEDSPVEFERCFTWRRAVRIICSIWCRTCDIDLNSNVNRNFILPNVIDIVRNSTAKWCFIHCECRTHINSRCLLRIFDIFYFFLLGKTSFDYMHLLAESRTRESTRHTIECYIIVCIHEHCSAADATVAIDNVDEIPDTADTERYFALELSHGMKFCRRAAHRRTSFMHHKICGLRIASINNLLFVFLHLWRCALRLFFVCWFCTFLVFIAHSREMKEMREDRD